MPCSHDSGDDNQRAVCHLAGCRRHRWMVGRAQLAALWRFHRSGTLPVHRRQTLLPPSFGNFSKEMEGLRISLLALFGWFTFRYPSDLQSLEPVPAGGRRGLAAGVVATVAQNRTAASSSASTCRCLYSWLGCSCSRLLIRWTHAHAGHAGTPALPRHCIPGLVSHAGMVGMAAGSAFLVGVAPASLLLLAIASLVFFIRPAYQPPPLISPDDIPLQHRLEPVVTDDRILSLGGVVTPETIDLASFSISPFTGRLWSRFLTMPACLSTSSVGITNRSGNSTPIRAV